MRPNFPLPTRRPALIAISALAVLLATTACATVERPAAGAVTRNDMIGPVLTTPDAVDSSTYAQPQQARVTHVALDLDLDFEARRVGGTATLDIAAQPGADAVVLDDGGLKIRSITDGTGQPLSYTVGQSDGERGAPLTIAIGEARRVTIAYTAPADAQALQWLDPRQTAGGEYPFLFSQGQAILNRSWIPTQDSPGIRQTWEARITAPTPLNVVMSGVRQGEPEDLGDGRRAFRFVMDKPVPPYLIALAAGDIVHRDLGPRTGVWAEPATIDAAASELADTEKMVAAAERLYGPYRWGRYDMIVLPPSFPYGGMENPVMTFLTPTFIAGDRSLNGLVAHELAHSWSGNLVTNAVWSDSWLNEGVTSYFENRILESLYGRKRAGQEAALAFDNITETLDRVGADAPGTALHQPEDVDSAGSAIIYDKGAYFLRTVESIVGRRRFDAWLRQWFDNHAFQPATSAMILADMRRNLVRGDDEARRLELSEWIYGTGLPDNVARPDPAAFAQVDAESTAYADARTLPADWAEWNSAERQRFLSRLPQTLDAGELERLDRALGLSRSGNSEELFLWLKLALANRYQPAVPRAEQFLAHVGRRKFVQPLFETLMAQGDWGQPIAKRIYQRTRDSYHPVTRSSVDRVVLKRG